MGNEFENAYCLFDEEDVDKTKQNHLGRAKILHCDDDNLCIRFYLPWSRAKHDDIYTYKIKGEFWKKFIDDQY